mmetsp:Transcript_136469/g.340286  ORF Transcript_136469/g.340286 Transcript_136469/m.340286 type:complete len:200 (+) Transcript_136469:309-908(+)
MCLSTQQELFKTRFGSHGLRHRNTSRDTFCKHLVVLVVQFPSRAACQADILIDPQEAVSCSVPKLLFFFISEFAFGTGHVMPTEAARLKSKRKRLCAALGHLFAALQVDVRIPSPQGHMSLLLFTEGAHEGVDALPVRLRKGEEVVQCELGLPLRKPLAEWAIADAVRAGIFPDPRQELEDGLLVKNRWRDGGRPMNVR